MAAPKFSLGALLCRLQCSLLCCFDESDRLNAACFSFASITLTLFEKPKQQNQEKCRGGYFRKDNRDQLVPGFHTGPMSTLTGAEWSYARSVLAIITSVSSEDKLAGSNGNTRKHRRQSTRKKNQLTWLRSPSRSMQNHHETDPKQQCDRDANCSVSTSSSVCTIAPLGTLSSHRTFSLYVHSPANISRCLSLFSSFLFWSSQSTFQEARLRDPKHYIGDEDSDIFFFWLLLARRE